MKRTCTVKPLYYRVIRLEHSRSARSYGGQAAICIAEHRWYIVALLGSLVLNATARLLRREPRYFVAAVLGIKHH